jgi:hypothetical protein
MIYSLYLPAKEFVVGVQDVSYYPLYDFPNPSHSKDLLDAFAQSKGYKFIYIKLPILRFDSWYEEENIDFKYPDNVRWFPDKKIQPLLKFSSQTVELVAGALTRKEGDYLLRSDVKKLGTLLGFHPSLWLDLIKNGHTQLIESPSTINIVKQALLGSVDAINLEPSVVNHHLKRLKKENQLVVNKELPLQIYSYHLSTIKYPEVMKEFNMFLAENQVLLETLKTKYQLVDVEPYRKLVSK